MAVLSGVAYADRYLTEIEELIMQVKRYNDYKAGHRWRNTDGQEHISWKETLTQKMQQSNEFCDTVKHELLIPRLGNHYSYHDSLVVID